jgi:hypothetical protein
MNKSTHFFLFSLLWLAANGSDAQNTSPGTDSLLIGTWKGSSICQVRNSPCHDETVVYHISKKPGNDTFYIQANKIVNGIEEDMGILPCLFDEKRNLLRSTVNNNIWSFLLKKDELEGELVYQEKLYRKIKLKKVH